MGNENQSPRNNFDDFKFSEKFADAILAKKQGNYI